MPPLVASSVPVLVTVLVGATCRVAAAQVGVDRPLVVQREGEAGVVDPDLARALDRVARVVDQRVGASCRRCGCWGCWTSPACRRRSGSTVPLMWRSVTLPVEFCAIVPLLVIGVPLKRGGRVVHSA